MASDAKTQPERALALLQKHDLLRLGEFLRLGITAATIRRLEQKGMIARVARGLYRLAVVHRSARHRLADVAARVPGATICLNSALAFHELTAIVPPRVWIAIGRKALRPRVDDPPLQIVRFGPRVLDAGVERHVIDGVEVRIYDPAKTIVDLFRYRHGPGARYRHDPAADFAIQGLRNGLRTGKAVPSRLARYAEEAGILAVLEPYLDVMTPIA